MKEKSQESMLPWSKKNNNEKLMLKEITGDEKRKNTWYFIKLLSASAVLPKSFYMNVDHFKFLIKLKKTRLWGN